MAGPYLAALRAWHQDLQESGRPESSLPTIRDLEVLSELPDLERAMLPQLRLERPEAVASFFAGIKGVMRTVSAEYNRPEGPAALTSSVPTGAPAPRGSSSGQASSVTSIRPTVSSVPTSGPPSGAPPTNGESRSNRRSRFREGGPPSPGRPTPTGSVSSDNGGATAPSDRPTAGGATGTSSGPPSEGPLRDAAFAPLDLEKPPADSPGLTPLTITVLGDGALQLGWSPADGEGLHVYRVVTSDEWMPYSPGSGVLLSAGTTTETVDPRPFTGPTRYVQVWVNTGSDRAEALAAQPRLLAQGTAVAPVTGVELRVSQGIVTGSWSVHDAIQRVEVHRVPAGDAARKGYLPRHRLTSVRGRATSLRDTGCVPGERYQYRFFAVVTTDEGSEVLSEPVVHTVDVPAPALPVQTLETHRYEEDGRTLIDLQWSSPSERSDVSIYVTRERPVAGYGEELPVSALPQAGLSSDDREFMKPEIVDGRAVLEGIPWPENSPRVYLTAVTMQGQRACVGATASLVDVGSISHVDLVQRVNWQLLTFDWPLGASSVQVFHSATGMPRPEGVPPLTQIDKETYEAQGGLRLRLLQQGELAVCDLHLLPISYSEGKPIEGRPVRVSYPGMLRLLYSLVEEQGEPTGRWNRVAPPSRWFIHLQSDQRQPPPMTLALVMVWHDARLPLDEGDGTVILRQRVLVPGFQPVPVAEFDRSRPGFYRLFVESDSSVPFHVALLDPPLHALLKVP